MNRLMVAAALVLAIAAPVGTAHAADWVLLDAHLVKCRATSELAPDVRSPAALETEERLAGQFRQTTVTRGADGAIVMVTVTASDGVAVVFFPTMELCQATRDEAVRTGVMTDPAELK
jgi:hypothetical protein